MRLPSLAQVTSNAANLTAWASIAAIALAAGWALSGKWLPMRFSLVDLILSPVTLPQKLIGGLVAAAILSSIVVLWLEHYPAAREASQNYRKETETTILREALSALPIIVWWLSIVVASLTAMQAVRTFVFPTMGQTEVSSSIQQIDNMV